MSSFQPLLVAAASLRSIPFYRYGIPLITIFAVSIALVYGGKGVIGRDTLLFIPAGAFGNATGAIFTHVRGAPAVVLGLLYWIVALLLVVILVPFSLGLLGLLEPAPLD